MLRTLFPKRILFVLTLITAFSCRAEDHSPTSDTAGFFSPNGMNVMLPKAKTPADMNSFRTGVVSAFDTYHMTQKPLHPHHALQGGLYQALEVSGGVPRPQVAQALEVLVAPTSLDCGGASCSKVFGLTESEISQFLDDARDIIAKNPVTNQKEKNILRDLLIASLTRPEEAQGAPKTLKERLAALPTKLPQATTRPKASLAVKDPRQYLTDREISLIQDYSYTLSKLLRPIETNHVEKLLDLGYSPMAIRHARDKAALINQALAKLPEAPGTTYRGIGRVSNGTLTDLLHFQESKKLITLGQRNLPALTSTSWDINIAQAFAYSTEKDKYNIIYIIRQRTGKTIEKMSRYPNEKEVLIPSDAIFQVGEISYINPQKRLLSVELIQVPRSGPL